MTENSTQVPAAPCPGKPHNCELLIAAWKFHLGRCAEAGISATEAVVSAMAVGLVIDVWRNSPVEGMHGSKRGLTDAAMFAESTSLHDRAVIALTTDHRAMGLLKFEEYLLDRTRPWAGTSGKTLKDFGYGFLGQYDRHVKDHINKLMSLNRHTCVADPLEAVLITAAVAYGADHKGMPRWPTIVDRIRILLADPAHPAWAKDGRGAQALAERPEQTPSSDRLVAALLDAPSSLPVAVLEWLSDHLLYCAGPPYGRRWGK